MDVLMPQLGETVAEGTIAVWHKQVGDEIAVDEILLDVETDKVAMEIPSPAAGILSAIQVPEGETVDVGTLLAVIQTNGDAEQVTAAGPTQTTHDTPTKTASTVTEVKRIDKADASAPPLSPAVRRLLAEHALEPSVITGTGRNGRIKRSDVLEYIETQQTKISHKPSQTEQSFIPFNRLRRVTAEHMVRSKATSPHVLQAVEADFNKIAKLRAEQSAAWKNKHGYSLTYLPFIAYAVCRAILEFPRINASIQNEGLAIHPQINLSIAVDLDHEGLLAPVIKAAEKLSVAELAQQINHFARLARDGKLKPDDLSGGTYTLSNSGSFGTLITAPIINQPQVAILSVDGIKKRAVVVSGEEGDAITIRPIGILAQSFDHRAIDGAYSAAFLQRLQAIIEQTNWQQKFASS